MSKNDLIIKESKNTFNFIHGQHKILILNDIVNIINEYLIVSLYQRWAYFFEEKEAQEKEAQEKEAQEKEAQEKEGMEDDKGDEFDNIQHFKNEFLANLKVLEEKGPAPERRHNALETLAFLLGKKPIEDRKINYHLWNYLKRVDCLACYRGCESIIRDFDVYELYEDTLLILPEGLMYHVFRLGPQEQSILLKVLFENSEYLNRLKEKCGGILARVAGYICWEQDVFKLVFLNYSQFNSFLFPILREIPQFINDEKQIQDRQLAPLTHLLDSIELLPPAFNKIVAEYSGYGEKYFADLAKSLLTQFKNLNEKYFQVFDYYSKSYNLYVLDIFEESLECIYMDIPAEFDWNPCCRNFWSSKGQDFLLRDVELNSNQCKYEYKAFKVIEKLIKGVDITKSRPKESESSWGETFYLLNFFKSLDRDHAANPAIDQFITDLLNLVGGYTCLSVSKILLQRECKNFSNLTGNSPFSLRLNAEQELNSFINQKMDEDSPVNFLMPDPADEKRVTLFVKTEARKTLELLRKNYTSMFVHLSPLYIDQLFNWVDTTFSGPKRPRHTLYLPYFFCKYNNIDPKNIEWGEEFQSYGCVLGLNQSALDILDKPGNDEKGHPVKQTLWNQVDALRKILEKFLPGEDKRVDIVHDFFNQFSLDFTGSMSDTDSGVEALQISLDLLKRTRGSLSQIANLFASNSSSIKFSFGRWANLTKAIKQTEEAMAHLENSIHSLLKKSDAEEIVLMLHSLTDMAMAGHSP
jgi:hypothetical protein